METVTLSCPGAKEAFTPGGVEPINTTVSVPSTMVSFRMVREAFMTTPFLVLTGNTTVSTPGGGPGKLV